MKCKILFQEVVTFHEMHFETNTFVAKDFFFTHGIHQGHPGHKPKTQSFEHVNAKSSMGTHLKLHLIVSDINKQCSTPKINMY